MRVITPRETSWLAINTISTSAKSPASGAAPGVVVTLLVVCLFAGLAWQFEYWRVSRLQHSRLALQADDLDRRLPQLAVLPRLLSADPRLHAALATNDDETVALANRTLARAQRESAVDFAFLMDTTGVTVAASNWRDEVSFVGRNYQFRPYFSGALAGRRSTFFAVGATTGVPGYFIADSVRNGDEVIGVVVVKLELDQLLNSWQADQYTSLLHDELGVVILATDPELLYTPARELTASELSAIADDRRYQVNHQSQLLPVTRFNWYRNGWHWRRDDQSLRRYVAIDRELASEPWTLRHLVPLGTITLTAAWYLFALLAIAALAVLGRRSYRQQRLLAQTQQRNAEQLEAEVQARTRELESAQQALIAEANFAMLGRMSAAINHEINQPLASLTFNLATLRKLIDSPDARAEDIRDTVVDSDRTTKRISRVIDTLRSVARQRNSHFAAVEIGRVLSDVVLIVRRERPVASKALQEARLESLLEQRDLRINGNEILLQQAFLNLLYNAFDATLQLDDPQVSLQIETDGHQVQILVCDNGAGVAAEEAEQLFEPFHTDPGRSSGLGLGLTLARQIVEDHGGTISYRPGSTDGSIFSVSLLLVDGDKP